MCARASRARCESGLSNVVAATPAEASASPASAETRRLGCRGIWVEGEMSEEETDKLVKHLLRYLTDCGMFAELFGDEEEADEVRAEIEDIVFEHVNAAKHRRAAGV